MTVDRAQGVFVLIKDERVVYVSEFATGTLAVRFRDLYHPGAAIFVAHAGQSRELIERACGLAIQEVRASEP